MIHPSAIELLAPFGVVVNSAPANDDLTALPVPELKSLLNEHRVLVLRGFGFGSSGDFEAYARRWGEPVEWSFGKVLELKQDEQAKDHIFDNSYVPLHWDGMYKPLVPDYLMFHCVDAPAPEDGGRTVFSDTTRALAGISPHQRASWAKLTGTFSIEEVAHYGGRARCTILTTHPRDARREVIRFHEPADANVRFLNRHRVELTGLAGDESAERVCVDIANTLRAPANFYAHTWQQGDILIADNHVLLHGREAFRSRCARRLQRINLLGDPPVKNPALTRTNEETGDGTVHQSI